jgi:hypothetical protein
MLLNNYTETQQNNFAHFCKTDELTNIDGLTEGRIHHYRRLIYGVIDDSLRSAYPLTENVLTEEEWDFLVDKFIAEHKCQSPVIWQMPFEFYEFINANDFQVKKKYPHLIDLIFFEWKEIEIYMMEDLNENIDNLLSDFNDESSVIINKEYDLVQLTYPVHLKSADKITINDSGNYFVLIFRSNDKVWFYNITPTLVRLIQKLADNQKSIMTIINEVAELNSELNKEDITKNIIEFIKTMYNKGFIIGFEERR